MLTQSRVSDDPTPSAFVAEEPISRTLSRLVEDGRELVAAEIGLVKARASDRITRYRVAATFFAVAGILALAALIALLVGLILTLAPRIGPGLATVAVVGGTLVVVVVLALIGKARLTSSDAGRTPA